MAKLSVVIPSRDERFLVPTIDDIFRNARGEIEVVAVLDSDKWPGDWKAVTDRHPNLHTIHNGKSIGMRGSINKGVASAISRGAKFIMKSDGHCSFSEGFDEVLKAECEPNWVVVPRRGRLDPEAWTATETHKPDIDYHYLSFPDNPQDFGGKGLNGKPWPERAVERKDVLLDTEMSSQGSCWFMHAAYFNELELMDEANYGTFWNEFQEIGLKCWLSGGKVMVNKKAKYFHLHKGTKYGRGYRLEESQLKKGAGFTKNWIWNEAWPKQTLPFKWLIEHFWPVPSWPENWEEVLYATRKPRAVGPSISLAIDTPKFDKLMKENSDIDSFAGVAGKLNIRWASYGYGDSDYSTDAVDVTERLRELVSNNSLDIVVNNSTITPNQNPFRGRKKKLWIAYNFDGGPQQDRVVDEKDWLIVGPANQQEPLLKCSVCGILTPSLMVPASEAKVGVCSDQCADTWVEEQIKPTRDVVTVEEATKKPVTAAALNDYLIRRFQVSPQRLRGPMPIELRDFHRNDLAQLFAELGFKRGAEIGVAEGNYSEVLLKANPECELLLVDPWHAYSDNPQNKSKEKHEFALNEVRRKVKGRKVLFYQENSMDALQQIPDIPLDFVYVDGNHLFDFVMQDLIEWSKRVRSGGIVSGDDYYALDQKRWIGGGVVEAVQAYVNAHRIPIWYIFQGHKSTDFMWVRP